MQQGNIIAQVILEHSDIGNQTCHLIDKDAVHGKASIVMRYSTSLASNPRMNKVLTMAMLSIVIIILVSARVSSIGRHRHKAATCKEGSS